MRASSARARLVLPSLLGLLGCQPYPDDVRDGVEATLGSYLEAVEAGDTAAVRAAFVEDGRLAWLERGEVRYRTVDDMPASLAAFAGESTLETRLEDLTVVPVGLDAAYAWARFETRVSGPEGFSFGGVLSFVLERTDRGWRIVGGHSS